ncbi:methyltransferase domain-containing protein [Aspergillus granulosus]|uniref:Protein-lysine N-methyltransferase EFM4 n=1 Tax=Aspergillus granulosus TaxID=176169 RepID=A0ABR4H507_9EURO
MADTSDDRHPTHLSPSELGTKEYWETFYSRTLTHISSKPNSSATPSAEAPPTSTSNDEASDDDDDDYNGDSDPGTSWFSEHNAPQKVLSFLTQSTFPLAPSNTLPVDVRSKRNAASRRQLSAEERNAQPSILDLGTGNGSMLALLRKRGGFRGTMVGVDYSEKSVELARELQRSRRHEAYLSDSDEEEEEEDEEYFVSGDEGDGNAQAQTKAEAEEEWEEIQFEEWDILNSGADLQSQVLDWFPYDKGGFDIVLDKGTFDAVSLMVEKSECERYPGIAAELVRKGGFLVVTSCNWTEEELVKWFTAPSAAGEAGTGDSKLAVWGRVQYPRFRFGGQEGQGVCTVCFQRI